MGGGKPKGYGSISSEEAQFPPGPPVAIIVAMKTTSLEILEKSQLPTAQAHAILKVMELEMTSAQEVLATKNDILLLQAATKSDLQIHRAATKNDLLAFQSATRNDIEALRAATKNDLLAFQSATRNDIEALQAATKNDLLAFRSATRNDIEALRAATTNDLLAFQSATRNDIEALRADTKSDILALRVEMKGIESGLSRWVLTCMLGQTGVLAGLGYFLVIHLGR
jgi:hypothetical protein